MNGPVNFILSGPSKEFRSMTQAPTIYLHQPHRVANLRYAYKQDWEHSVSRLDTTACNSAAPRGWIQLAMGTVTPKVRRLSYTLPPHRVKALNVHVVDKSFDHRHVCK
jgi:hypothetical protein